MKATTLKPRTVSIPKRGYNFDTLMWLFVRFSALAMYLFALIAIVGALIMGARTQMSLPDLMRWAFIPESTHVALTNVVDLNAWKTVFWHGMAILMLVTAGAHGLHGLLNVLEDYFPQPGLRRFLRVLILVVWAVMSAIGSYVILTY